MTDLSKRDREELEKTVVIDPLFPIKTYRSKERGVEKYLFKTTDGHTIEAVKIKSYDRITVCVSSQAGCPLKCSFCATGAGEFKRDLTAGEILSQLLHIVGEGEHPVTNIVFMGMGEPFLNYKQVMKAIGIINSKDEIGMGARRITVSTCGLPDKIRLFAKEETEVNLSVSLNAANDKTRSRIMKINNKFPIEDVLSAVRYYLQKTNRRVTFEYVMILGVNDTIKDAKELSLLLQDMLCHVNLIPFNPYEGSTDQPSTKERLELFRQILVRSGVNATIRKSKGSDIAGACGQLGRVQNAKCKIQNEGRSH